MLQDCGMGNIIGPALEKKWSSSRSCGFLIAALIRVSVGAAVVAMTMAAGIMAAMPELQNCRRFIWPRWFAQSMEGATAFSHVNDSGFWLVNSLLEIDEKTTLKSWTIMGNDYRDYRIGMCDCD